MNLQHSRNLLSRFHLVLLKRLVLTVVHSWRCLCAYLHDSSGPAEPCVHNWMHCSGSSSLSAEDRLNCRSVTDRSPAEGCGPAPEKCTLSAVTMKASHITQVDVGGSASRWRWDLWVLVFVRMHAHICEFKCLCTGARLLGNKVWTIVIRHHSLDHCQECPFF